MPDPGAQGPPLAGLRVLDLTEERGALAGRILADLGAEVLALPPRPVPDDLPPAAATRRRARQIARRLGKRVVELELPRDAARARELAAGADVLIESSPPGTLEAWGLGGEVLWRDNPGLVLCSITPWGRTGPWAGFRGSDLTVAAASGNLFLTGDPERPPVRCAMPVSEYHAGAEAAAGILMALWHRERTGRGQHVDVSMQEAMVGANVTYPAQCWKTGQRGRRTGAGYRVGAVFQREIWPCRDGYVTFALRGGPARIPGLMALVRLMDEHGMAPRHLREKDWSSYNHNTASQEEIDAISEAIAAFFRTRTMEELYEAACEHRLMLAPANTERQVLASRQLASRRFFATAVLPDAGQVRVPARFAAWEGIRARPAGEERAAGFSGSRGARPAVARPTAGEGPIFEGLRILELGSGAAGPLATRYFADQGAVVVKLESRRRPDFLRLLRDTGKGDLDASLFFACVNPNKRSVAVNLRDPKGVQIARRLALWADVVIENFAPGVLAKRGLDHATLAREHPRLIMLSTCLWGQTGPERSYPGFGGQGSALAGYNYLTGWPDSEPVGPFGTITDTLSPRFAAAAVTAALLQRERTGRGACIDLSQVEAGVYCLGEWILAFQLTGASFGRQGNRCEEMVPHGVYPAAGEDRWIALAVHDDADWSRLVGVLGRPAWAADPALRTAAGRREREATIDAGLAEWTRVREARQAAGLLRGAGLDAAPVEDMQDLLHNAQLAHREHFQRLVHPVLGETVVEQNAIRWSASRSRFDRAAPCLGADTREVLREVLGLGDAELEELKDVLD